jgi:hypothetical protein
MKRPLDVNAVGTVSYMATNAAFPGDQSCTKRVLANRTLYAYANSCLVNRLWVPITVWPPSNLFA